jgi:hypothetical protein
MELRPLNTFGAPCLRWAELIGDRIGARNVDQVQRVIDGKTSICFQARARSPNSVSANPRPGFLS